MNENASSPYFHLVQGHDLLSPPLVLLHGSGGSEVDLLPLAEAIAPNSAKLALRGAIKWEDGYAFFRRFPDRRIDESSLYAQVPTLASIIAETTAQECNHRPVLVGFSNGAIMAAALVLLYPNLASGAVLLRPLWPFSTPISATMPDTPVLVIDAIDDPRRRANDGLEIAAKLKLAGAKVEHFRLPVGHALTHEDTTAIRGWLSRSF
jgi:phospholipase/carboxylesterase